MASELLYDPDVGRFINQDTYLGENGTPPSLHRYLYAYNNPNLYTDPDGHSVAGMDMDRSGFRHTLPEKFNRPEHEAIRDAGDKGGAIGGALVIGAVTGGLSISACAVSGVCSGLSLLGGTAASLSDPDVDSLIPSGKITKKTSQAIDAVSEATKKSKKSLSATPTKENKSGSIAGAQQSKNKNKNDSATKSSCACGGRCFVAGTLISTIDGLKPIEDIQLGDLVAARDENNSSGEISWKPVTELFFNDDDRTTNLVTLEDVAGEQELYEVTDNHPFYIDGRGWVDVDHLEPGMQVLSSAGSLLTIIDVQVQNSSPVTYNIEVDSFHTYFVGELGAWVHNQNNPNCAKVCGRSSNKVKRAVTPQEAETIKRGEGIIKPKPAQKTTATQHVMGTKHSRDPHTSATRSDESAEFFATHGHTKKAGPIVEIDLNKVDKSNVVDVSSPEKARKALKHKQAQNFASGHKEVLIKGDIPPDAITPVSGFD